eukprot:gnl/Dysnectes_brevis/4127_a5434_1047.p1 GENE.gnl/Dysnectes_brevis/4127_a5434_1047~~gnl/Dysnectes_brevis/4127_a5434_1047.p1  ORF type:complete len:321 (-),score=18.34 gnl/Dysnectes_brevis/4127_a5434_1047:30-992(-)
MISKLSSNLLQDLKSFIKPSVNEVKSLLSSSIEHHRDLPNMIELEYGASDHVTMISDIHGEHIPFESLLSTTLEQQPLSPLHHSHSLISLGDIVDRGPDSLACVLLSAIYSLEYSSSFHQLRGNHEDIRMASHHGTKRQVFQHYCEEDANSIWTYVDQWFRSLPVAAKVALPHGESWFMTHGGIGNFTMEEINSANRHNFTTVGGSTPDVIEQLLWNDPEDYGYGFSKSPRGAGQRFCEDITTDFCTRFDVDRVLRGHEVVPRGLDTTHKGRVLTLFSAPDYKGSTIPGGKLESTSEKLDLVLFDINGGDLDRLQLLGPS